MRLKQLFLVPLFLAIACSTIKYADDLNFLVSAQANSPEFPVWVNGKLCRDMDGQAGLCAKRIKSNEPIAIRFDAQSYAYAFHIKCTTGVGVDETLSIEAGKEFTYAIKPEQFSAFRFFTCDGEITPRDRPEPISAKWQVRIMVVDAQYVGREAAYLTSRGAKSYLVMGEHARRSWVYDWNEIDEEYQWKQYNEKTTIRVYKPEQVRAYSESYSMRYNYFGAWD